MNYEKKKSRNLQRKNQKSIYNTNFSMIDNQSLIKQKKQLSSDISKFKKSNNNLQKAVNDAQHEFDEKQLVEIEYLYRFENQTSSADSQYKTMTFSKQINHLETELNKLIIYGNHLNKYFSEEALSQVKVEVQFEKHIIAQQKEELERLQNIYKEDHDLYNSKKYLKTVNKHNEQKKTLAERKKELKAIRDEEKVLNDALEKCDILPKLIQKEENEVNQLQKRLDNMVHAKYMKTRDLNTLKNKIETENEEMQKKKKNEKTRALRTPQRTSQFTNPKSISRRIRVSQPSSPPRNCKSSNQSPRTKRIQNDAVKKSSKENHSDSYSEKDTGTNKYSSNGSSSDYEKEINSDSYKNKPTKTEKALSANISNSSESSPHNSGSESQSSEAENSTDPHSGKHTSSEDEEPSNNKSINSDNEKSDASLESENHEKTSSENESDKNKDEKSESEEEKNKSENEKSDDEEGKSEDEDRKNETEDDKSEEGEYKSETQHFPSDGSFDAGEKEQKRSSHDATSDSDRKHESDSEGSPNNRNNEERQELSTHEDKNEYSSGSFAD